MPSSALGYPKINVSGLSAAGDNTGYPIYRHTNTFQLVDGLDIEHGSHLLKIGGEVRKLELNGILDLLTRGSLSFFGLSGSGISDLLLGYPSIALQATSNNPIAMRSIATAGYFEDDWRITHNLTLNLGARYEFVTPPVDPKNQMSTLNLQTGQDCPRRQQRRHAFRYSPGLQ